MDSRAWWAAVPGVAKSWARMHTTRKGFWRCLDQLRLLNETPPLKHPGVSCFRNTLVLGKRGPPRFHTERRRGSVPKTLLVWALGIPSIRIPSNKTIGCFPEFRALF